ncbi:protein kinase domain-containing protein [Actibacterium pelagium]|uniref:non-specific serine/threonine protein kinase n=1 Tax=Actibacterium pelagium TaxID=2029103 RepID=A0A917EGL5_9RHOB|nr:protein kinase [Actibacterium pelagium]GGE37331.1 hypothetical protein GCM10011517_01340 [Actibacterium pelagium]
MQQQKMDGAETEKEYVDELKPGTQLLQGQYTIDSFLNSGGFGITYLAKDSLDRRIVIKECFPGSFCRRSKAIVAARSRAHQNEFRSVVKLFMQEARSLAKLVHPNIVGVHQVFEDNETAYMAIDYVDGRDLLDLIEDPAFSIKPEEVVNITKKLLSAVAFVHDNDVLHRDISPDNILMQKDGEPILIDFGAAREQATKASRALSALRVVKDGYSPQEFYVAGSQQGPWSDLYALAASLYHVIKNEAPINSQVRLAAVAEGRGDPYVPLAGSINGYPDGFLEAIDKAMQTVPAQRLQNAQEWLDMFQGASTEKVVPLKTEKAAAPKAKSAAKEAAPTPTATKQSAQAASAPKAAKSSGGGSKVALLGTAAAVAIAAGVGFFLMSSSSEEVTVTAEPTVISKPAPKPVETATATTATTPKPAETSQEAPAQEPVATAAAKPETAPAAKPTPVTQRAPTTSASSPSTTRPATNTQASSSASRPSATSFADIIATTPGTSTTRSQPTARVTTSPTTTASSPTTASRPATTARATTTPARPAPTPTTTNSQASSTTSSTSSFSSGGANSFTDFLASQSRSQTPSTTTSRSNVQARTSSTSSFSLTTRAPSVAPRAETQDSNALFANIVGNGSTGFARPATRSSDQGSTPVQVTEASWAVDLPFNVTVTRRQGNVVALITSISDSSAAGAAGSWVEEGIEIHKVNGEAVTAATSIASMVLENRSVDPSGIVRTPVTIKKVGAQNTAIDALTLSAKRNVVLDNGIELESSLVSGKWTTKVTRTGPGSTGLQFGDVLLNERTTGTALTGARSLEQALGDLVTNGASTAQFDVQRGTSRAVANMALK